MQVSEADRSQIVRWAEKHHCIEEVWLYGSRARRDNRPNSDIDLAIVMEFETWFDWHTGYQKEPDLQLSHPVHLEWYHPNATDLKRVGPGVKSDGVLLYKRSNEFLQEIT